ncbi:MAG: hypothetical protein RLY16_2796 [Bacteroidota bacterium]
MSNNEQFDAHIRSLFDAYEPPVNDNAWDRLQAAREKNKPAGAWWHWRNYRLYVLAIVAVVAGFAWWWNSATMPKNNAPVALQNASNAAKDNMPIPNSNAAENANQVVNESKQEIGGKESTQVNNADKTDAPLNNAEASTQVKNGRSVGTNRLNSTASNDADIVTFQPKQTKVLRGDSHLPNSTVAMDDHPEMNRTSLAAVLKKTTPTENKSGATQQRNNRKNGKRNWTMAVSKSDITQSGELSNSDKSSDLVVATDTQANDVSLQSDNSTSLVIIDGKPVLFTADLLADKSNRPVIDDKKIPDCPGSPLNGSSNRDYFDFYFGPDVAMKQYADTANSVYLQKRKESTKVISAFSAGMRYTRVFGNGVSFRTGFNYSQINEKFSFVKSNLVQLIYVIDPVTGDTTGSERITGTRYKTTYNRFKSLDIPLLIGYEMGNNRWHTNFNAGVVLNVYNWQKGDVLDTAFQPVQITTGKASNPYQYKTNAGLSFSGAVSVYYQLNARLHLMAEPYIRYHFSPISNSAMSLQEKFTTIGMRLGVRFDF